MAFCRQDKSTLDHHFPRLRTHGINQWAGSRFLSPDVARHVLERRPKVVTEIGGYALSVPLLGRICTLTHSQSIWSHPFSLIPLSLSVSDACRCRTTWWGEIVNDASHRKSGSPGHATPSPVSSSSMGLYLWNSMSHNQGCTWRTGFAVRSTWIGKIGASLSGERDLPSRAIHFHPRIPSSRNETLDIYPIVRVPCSTIITKIARVISRYNTAGSFDRYCVYR